MQNKYFQIILLIVSLVFFVLGLAFPILATKYQILGIAVEYKEIKLIDTIKIFYKSKEYLLAGIIFIFTIIIPFAKYIELSFRIIRKKLPPILNKIDKWSMIDVFIVALLLINYKLDSNIIVTKLKIGTNFIAISIILRIAVSSIINKNN